MKTTGYLVSSTAEFTTCMENGKYYFDCRNTCLFIDSYRNATTVINNSDRIIRINCYFYFCTKSSQCFIYSIVNYLIYKMMKTSGRSRTNIHSRSFSYSFKSFKNLNLISSVFIRHSEFFLSSDKKAF